MFVLGTAGHIDHGKSALVQALTGMDPDRLREEKERGMTLDLGFAWLKLPKGGEVGIVDVPGHERFIHNMLAGVGGIDLAMLVVAANEGVMPQTREHVAILDLLEIKKCVVAVTKKDLVDEEWLALVKMDVEELLQPTTMAKSPIVAVSSVTREGLPELVATIEQLLSTTEAKRDIGRPRLPIDRIFTIAGSGTIVTGTLIDGSLTSGQNVEIVPGGIKSRLRGLQTHKSQVATATPGSRVAANIVGVTTTEIKRGCVLTNPDWLQATDLLTGSLRLLASVKRPLRHNTAVSFHTGAAETMAKVRLLEANEIHPGSTGLAQFVLDEPVALVSGDHYIIRSTEDTLGGGKVIDAHASRIRRNRADIIQGLQAREKGTAGEAVLALMETKQSLELPALISQSDLPENEARAVIEALIRDGKLVSMGQPESPLLMTSSGWRTVTQKATQLLQEYHKKYPMRSGMPQVELGKKLFPTHAADVLRRLSEEKVTVEEGLIVRLPVFEVKLSPAQQTKINAFLKSLADSPYAPPSDLIPEPELLSLLIERKQVVKVSDGVVFSAKAYNEMLEKITAYIKTHGKITLAEVRDMFGNSRKYAQAIIEYLDKEKITRRTGDERVLWGGN